MSHDLVVLGNLIVDDIVYDNGEMRLAQPGGATLYMGLAARLWNLDVGLVSIAGSDFPTSVLAELEEHGIDMAGVRRSQNPGLRTWLLYEGHLRRVLHRLDGATHLQASPTVRDIPDKWRPRAIHLAPMPFGLQSTMVSELSSRFGDKVLVSLDPFELLSPESLPKWRSLLSLVDLFFVSEDEVPASDSRRDPEPFLRQLFAGRLDKVLYKQGSTGGLALRRAPDADSSWPSRATLVADTTGAGDAFASGVLAGLLRHEPLERALQQGVVSASFAIQGEGAEALLEATPETAQRRLNEWFGS